MNGDFVYDAGLFRKALLKVYSTVDSLTEAASAVSSVKSSFPDEYEFRDSVLSACDIIEQVKGYIDGYKGKVESLLADLCSLDEDFARKVNTPSAMEDISNAVNATGAEWKKGFKSLVNGKGTKDLKNAWKDTKATAIVTGKSIQLGVNRVGEHFGDGYLTVKSLFQKGEKKQATIDEIRRNKSQEKYDAYFQTKKGKEINKRSNLKYDSAGAKGIAKVAEKGTEYLGATAATILTGGVASGFVGAGVAGAALGIGKGAEAYAMTVDREHGESYDNKKLYLNSAKQGFKSGIEWGLAGQAGKGLTKIPKAGDFSTTAEEIVKNRKDIFNLKNMGARAAEGFTEAVSSKEFIATTAGSFTEHGINVALGEESVDEAIHNSRAEIGKNIVSSFGGSGEKAITKGLSEAGERGYKFVAKQVKDIFNETETGQKVKQAISDAEDKLVEGSMDMQDYVAEGVNAGVNSYTDGLKKAYEAITGNSGKG